VIQVPLSPLVKSVLLRDTWVCEQCGLRKPGTWRNAEGRLYHRKSRFCSGACRGASMTGKANPAYTTGARTAPRLGRTRKPMTEWQVTEIERWMRLRDRSVQQLADMIGATRRAVHKRKAAIAARQHAKVVDSSPDAPMMGVR